MLQSLVFPTMLRELFFGKSLRIYENSLSSKEFEEHLNKVIKPNIWTSFKEDSFEIGYKETYIVNGFGTVFYGRFKQIDCKEIIIGKFIYPIIAKIFVGVEIIITGFVLFSPEQLILSVVSWYLVIHAFGLVVLMTTRSNAYHEELIKSYLIKN